MSLCLVVAPVPPPLPADDQAALAQAVAQLERLSLATRISQTLGSPLEGVMRRLPARWAQSVNNATQTALEKALDVALWSLDPQATTPARRQLHQWAVTATGAAGGALGLAALSVELPLSTTLMLRAIADIAREQGEDLADPATRLECLQVLALGGRREDDNAAETGYFAARTALAQAVSAAVRHLAQHGLSQQGAPVMVKLLAEVVTRFSVQVSQKAAAQTVPILGAAGGAALNALFMQHFQDVAQGHFTVRRLERQYGPQRVQSAYQALLEALPRR